MKVDSWNEIHNIQCVLFRWMDDRWIDKIKKLLPRDLKCLTRRNKMCAYHGTSKDEENEANFGHEKKEVD